MSFFDTTEDIARANRSLAAELPATFSDTFYPAWRDGLLFGQSVASSTARMEAMTDFVGDVYRRTGVNLPNPELGGISLDEFNAEFSKVAARHPELGRQQDQADAAFRPVTDEEIDQLATDHAKRNRIDYQTLQQRARTFGGTLGLLAGQASAGITDPVNLIAFPLAAPEALGVLGTTLAWGGIAGASQAAIEVAGAGFREQVQPGYQASGEPAANIAGAAAFGGAVGGSLKGISTLWTRVKTGEWPRSIRDAGNIVESEANIAATNVFPGAEGEAAHRTAMQRSIDALVSGRPVDVDDVVTPSILASYERRLAPVMEARAEAMTAGERGLALEREAARLPATMERLSEVQLDEVRRTGARIEADNLALTSRLDQQAEGFTAERAALTERRAAQEGQRGEIEGIRTELADRQQRLAQARPPVDELTQGRLDAIDGELARPNLGGDARALLQAERTSITETLEKTAPGDRKLAASLGQEIKGLERALARAEKAAARAEATATRGEARLTAGEKRVATTRDLSAGRLTSQRTAVRTEMVRSVRTLADEGYGLKLPRTDAEAFADRILRAGDDEAETVLRGITNELIERAQSARAAAGPATEAGANQARIAQNYTVATRDHIRRLAREMGVDMPFDDAAAIAARVIASRTDNEALAILDELMLRPRTLAESLPGPVPRETPVVRAQPAESQVRAQEAALAPELTPAAARKLRDDPATAEAVQNDFDRLRATKDVQVPDEVIDASGARVAVMRSADDIMADADARIAAAKEIAACATPQTEAA